uniref:Dehydrogenase/reductase SDR family member 1 n=1 Tax=Hemiselmis tepida TaxID=464990 RepID=A0A7S0W5S0_9CRYP|mmetsp:Transcript_4835/g.12394  ORF Transcript_4835/g.12394 Transcript_4835/m.12394 type:complete len:346 (+) Transcript_4835:32-1069(+)
MLLRVAQTGLILSVTCMALIKAMAVPPKMVPNLRGKVAVVTGASRGIGRGIALGLGDSQATVYVTGRTEDSVRATADEVTARGGKGIGVVCDHSDDEALKRLFEQIKKEQPGGLDVVVHNAFSGVKGITGSAGKKFWEKDAKWWDEVNQVGLRSHFVSSQLAVPLMLEGATKESPRLIVTVSSIGGSISLFDVAYGAGKAAKDKMAKDMAVDLKDRNIASISLWPGPVMTEFIAENLFKDGKPVSEGAKIFQNAESTLYSGYAVSALARDKSIMGLTGRTLLTEDLGQRYGFTEADGSTPFNFRQVRSWATAAGVPPSVAKFVPGFLKMPTWVFAVATSKFNPLI